ncbi:MAG: DUF2148 domain-containing protein [Candidatus Omnitrophica bacterium]|nr:DUF2148 domain-containing protein [Candidatus Omnitrophota bacterium]MDD5351778.1 DUF2148 domain-containing protein [Candidatus Omnitrophota bacterium]MDD5550604.1 DUF2148 domain-containing protein [Candidatus Omnitrophota bacterium]
MNYQKEIRTAIDLIAISVRTAPKSGGIDDIVFLAAGNQQKNRIAREMINIGKEKSKSQSNKAVRQAIITSWATDAKALQNSQGLVLVGVRGKKAIGFNCGGCGFKNCLEFQAHNSRNKNSPIIGPFCMFKIWDLGIAIDSAAKTASMLNVDNRIMYRIGIAALRLKIPGFSKKSVISRKVSPVLGLPLSVSGKNIYFDRLDKLGAAKILADYFKSK